VSAMKFAALGDSITVGLGDPAPGGGWRGWAALLARSLAPEGRAEFHNFADCGALARDVAARQLPQALRLRPDFAAVVVGVNDTLRDTFDAAAIGRALDETVGALRSIGAVVLTTRLPDPGRMLRLPGALARPLARRISAVNAVTDTVAGRHQTVHFDAADHPATYDRRMWSVDRLHPSERGHRFLAASFAELLAAAGVPVYERPATEPTNPEPSRRAKLWWLATQGTRWLIHRSTDLLPYLLSMAANEWWDGVRGHRYSDQEPPRQRDLEGGRIGWAVWPDPMDAHPNSCARSP
jgi:lysophospholipase L1-like esterase